MTNRHPHLSDAKAVALIGIIGFLVLTGLVIYAYGFKALALFVVGAFLFLMACVGVDRVNEILREDARG